jgi:hypothetical protein
MYYYTVGKPHYESLPLLTILEIQVTQPFEAQFNAQRAIQMSSLKLQSLAHAEGDPDIPKAAYAEHRALHTCGFFRLFSAGCAPEESKIRRHLDPILHISDLWTY